MLGLTCIRNTAKHDIPHQLTKLLCNFIFVKNNSNDIAPIIVVGQMYENKSSGILLFNKNGIRKETEVTSITQRK